MGFWPSFDGPWRYTIRTLADTMRAERAVERRQEGRFRGGCGQEERRAKGIDGWECSCTAEHTWHEPGLPCRGHHDAPHQIIGQDVPPEVRADHRRGFAPHAIHPPHCLERSESKFGMPPATIQVCACLFGVCS